MLKPKSLETLPIGQPIDSVRQAILREAGLAAEAWCRCISEHSTAVLDVLGAEQRLARQLGALGIVADARLYRRLRARLLDEDATTGATFVAAFVLLHHDKAASEAFVVERWWQGETGAKHDALSTVLALCGVRSTSHTTRLNKALTSQNAEVVQHAASLVAKLGPLRAWPAPSLKHTAGLCAALTLMRSGAIAPLPEALHRAAEHAQPDVRQAGLRAHQALFPHAALAHCRSLAHKGRDQSARTLELLGLLHDKTDFAAEHDLTLLVALSAQADTAEAAVDALGLTGSLRAAEACLKAAACNVALAARAARSLQAIFALDDEFWAAYAKDDGALHSDALQAAYSAHIDETSRAPIADFQPRSVRGLRARLRCCDMAHLHARADEVQMRSAGLARLYPWAYLTPQLSVDALVFQESTAQQPLALLRSPHRPGKTYG